MANNRFNKILFVNLYYVLSGYGEKLNFPPLGIGYIIENLKKNGFMCQVLDLCIEDNYINAKTKIENKISVWKPDIIGFSLNSINIDKSMNLIEEIKKCNKDISIILGGPHISSKKDEVLLKFPFIDYISIFEGENTIKELMQGIDLKGIKGLGFRYEGEIHLNPSETIADINNLSWPKYEDFDFEVYQGKDEIGILTSRGCPYKCGFCQQSSLIGKKWRGRSAEDIIEEIIFWKNKGKGKIHIIDDMFLMDKKRVIKISQLISKNGLQDLDFISVGGFRINHCDHETLIALRDMGVKTATFGIESGSDRVLKFIKKDITREQIEKVINEACELGFGVKLFFIIGLPTQTKSEVEESFQLALKYPIKQVRFFNFIPYEDTFLMNWLVENDAKFYYTYDEYMADFKKFQNIPIFEDKYGMTIEEKLEMIKKAREIEALIDKRVNKA